MSALSKILAVGVVLALCAASSALAASMNIFIMTDALGDVPLSWDPAATLNGDGSYHYEGSRTDTDGHWQIEWLADSSEDPFISAGYTLTNLDPVNTLTFTLVTTQPVGALLPFSFIGGSTGGSVTDANADAVGTVSTAGGKPFYEGLLDGAAALPIYPHLSSWTVPFAGGTANIPAANVGLPGPTIFGPGVLTDIGIEHHFTLTPLDRIAITSFFQAETRIPEPTSLVLLALGAVGLLRRR